MIRSMVIRDIRTRHIGSFLGIFWSIIHPLTQLLLYYLIFAVVLKMRLGPEYGGTHFAIWLIAGLLPWLFFADVVTRSPGAVRDQSNLIKKMVFPSEILPVVQLTAGMVNHFIGVGILLLFLILVGPGILPKIFFLLPYLLTMSILALGISWLLSAMNVFLRDVGQIIGVLIQLWFFLTPILYPARMIPDGLKGIFFLNPMLHAVEGYRMALLGKVEFDVFGFLYLLCVCILIFIIGGMTFKKLKPDFADVL